jgi:hypothetical protein
MSILKIQGLIKQGMTIPILGIETNYNLFLSKKSLFNRLPCPTKNGAIVFNSLLFMYLVYLLTTSVYDGDLGLNITFIATVAVAALLFNFILGLTYFLKIRTSGWSNTIYPISSSQGAYSIVEKCDSEMIGFISSKAGAFDSDITGVADILCRYVIKKQKIDHADFVLMVMVLAIQHSRANGPGANVSHGALSELVMIDYLIERSRCRKDTDDLLEARKVIESKYQNQLRQISAAKNANVINSSSAHKKLTEMPSAATVASVVMAVPISPASIITEERARPVSASIEETDTMHSDESSPIVSKLDAVDVKSFAFTSAAVHSDKIIHPSGPLDDVLIAGETEPEQEGDFTIGLSESFEGNDDEVENSFFRSQDGTDDNNLPPDEDAAQSEDAAYIEQEIDDKLAVNLGFEDDEDVVDMDVMLSFASGQAGDDSDFPFEQRGRDIDFDCESELSQLLHDLK